MAAEAFEIPPKCRGCLEQASIVADLTRLSLLQEVMTTTVIDLRSADDLPDPNTQQYTDEDAVLDQLAEQLAKEREQARIAHDQKKLQERSLLYSETCRGVFGSSGEHQGITYHANICTSLAAYLNARGTTIAAVRIHKPPPEPPDDPGPIM